MRDITTSKKRNIDGLNQQADLAFKKTMEMLNKIYIAYGKDNEFLMMMNEYQDKSIEYKRKHEKDNIEYKRKCEKDEGDYDEWRQKLERYRNETTNLKIKLLKFIDNYKKTHSQKEGLIDSKENKDKCKKIIESARMSLENQKNDEDRHLAMLLTFDLEHSSDQLIAEEIHYLNEIEDMYNFNETTINNFSKKLEHSKSNSLLLLKTEYIPILIETNNVLLSSHNKISQLISAHINKVKDKIKNHEFVPEILDTYPKMINHLQHSLVTLKSKPDHNWTIWSNFVSRWTSYMNDLYNSVDKNTNNIELNQINEIRKLLDEIRDIIGSNYSPQVPRSGSSS